MALMVLDGPVGLPAGPLAAALRQHFPNYRWQVGDGPQDGIQPLDRPSSIMGRSREGLMLIGLDPVDGVIDDPAAPPHRCHLRISGPTVDDPKLAERLLLLVGAALATQGGGALLIEGGGRWIPAAELRRYGGEDGSPAGAATRDEASPAPPGLFPRGTGSDRPSFGRRQP